MLNRKILWRFFLIFIFVGCHSFFSLTLKKTRLFSLGKGPENFNLKDIVVFGDSFSDQGNLLSFITHYFGLKSLSFSHPPARSDGKVLCDGKLLIEFLAEDYGIEMVPCFSVDFFSDFVSEKEKDSYFSLHKKRSFSLRKFLEPMRNKTIIDKDLCKKKAMKSFQEKRLHRPLKKNNRVLGNNYAFSMASLLNYCEKGAIDFEEMIFDRFNLERQIEFYRNYADKKDIKDTLFIISIGTYDIINSLKTLSCSWNREKLIEREMSKRITAMIKVFVKSILHLQTMGAKKILIIPTHLSEKIPLLQNAKASSKRILSQFSRKFEEMLQKTFAKNSLFKENEILCLPMIDKYNKVLSSFSEKFQSKSAVFMESCSFLATSVFDLHFFEGFNQEDLDAGLYPFFEDIAPTQAFNEKLFHSISRDVRSFIQSFPHEERKSVKL